MHGWTPLLIGHVAGATVALFLGAFNLLRPRRGDRAHKIVGYVWVALMYWVALSSFWIHDLTGGFSPIHVLSVVVLVTLSLAIVQARRHNVKAHRSLMRGTYLGLVGALIGAVAAPSRLVPQLVLNEPIAFVLLTLAAAVVASVVVGAAFFWFGPRPPPPVPDDKAKD